MSDNFYYTNYRDKYELPTIIKRLFFLNSWMLVNSRKQSERVYVDGNRAQITK